MSKPIVLPRAPRAWDEQEEARFRDAVSKALRDLSAEIENTRNLNTKSGTLALRRHQFLLMGMRSS